MNLIVSILFGAIFVLYLAYVVLFYTQQRKLLFPAVQRSPLPHIQANSTDLIAAEYPTENGVGFAWFLPARTVSLPAPTIIVAHGNGEINDDWVESGQIMQARGYNVLLLEYPGYGRAPGQPSQASIADSSVAAYDWLVDQPAVDPAQIIFVGHSIGGGVMTDLARQRSSSGMVLMSTFESMRAIARDRYLPPFLAKDKFDNISLVREYDRPILLMHGIHDTLIPYHHSERLHVAAADSQLEPLNCGHGGCFYDWHAFWDKVERFAEDQILAD